MVKRILAAAAVFAMLSTTTWAAGPADDVQAGIKKLDDSANYSWTTTIQGGFGQAPADCKTEKAGYTTFTAQTQDASRPVVIKGDKGVAKTDAGWKTVTEMAAAPADGGFSPDFFLAMQVSNFKTPLTQLKEVTEKLDTFKKVDDAYTADLSSDAVKKSLAFKPLPGMEGFQVDYGTPKGDIKVWLKDGAVSKVVIHVTGTVSFNGNDNPLDRTTTIEIKDVGSTKIDVPDDAKKKLDAPAATAPAK